jgi:hypothetical protein
VKQLKLTLAGPEHAKEIAEWLRSTKGNLYDEEIFKSSSLAVLRSFNGDGAVAYLPAQNVLVLESLAVKPGALPIETGQAFRDLVKGMEIIASQRQIREIYMPCADENVLRIAESHGFERLPWPITRLKL